MSKNTNINSITDLELIDIYKSKNDKSIIGELFKRYTKFVFAICMKYLKNIEKSEEAVMQIFEKLFTDLLKHNIDNFKSWLHVVTKNYCLHLLRSESFQIKRDNEIKNTTDLFMEKHDFLYLDSEDNSEDKLNRLEMAINSLSIDQKNCIDLFYLQEKCYDEVAKITGYTMNQVKSYIQNGKRNLKIYLTNRK